MTRLSVYSGPEEYDALPNEHPVAAPAPTHQESKPVHKTRDLGDDPMSPFSATSRVMQQIMNTVPMSRWPAWIRDEVLSSEAPDLSDIQ